MGGAHQKYLKYSCLTGPTEDLLMECTTKGGGAPQRSEGRETRSKSQASAIGK